MKTKIKTFECSFNVLFSNKEKNYQMKRQRKIKGTSIVTIKGNRV